ncbi:MAG: hypothetical protein MJZ75_03710 [Paludibacteraceae bacterium]|nr:hypothetical protein [Paludibacteraceae bacterium]
MAKSYKCPDCGMVMGEPCPDKCPKCACPSNLFKCIDTSETSYSNRDEQRVRGLADGIFGVLGLFGIVDICVGIAILVENYFGSEILGGICLLSGFASIIFGVVIRSCIRLFANISERLTNIDKKLKQQ